MEKEVSYQYLDVLRDGPLEITREEEGGGGGGVV